MRAKQFITELYNRPYELQARTTGFANVEYLFQLEDGRPGKIMFDSFVDDSEGMMKLLWVQVHFYIDDEYFYAGGDTPTSVVLRIFATVKAACDDYLSKTKPPLVVFESDDPKKRSIYLRMVRQFPGYVPYTNWRQDPNYSAIMDASGEGLDEDMVVLRRKDYQPRLQEFAPEGFEQYSLYTSDGVTRHFMAKYSSIEDAVEEVNFLWDTDPKTRLVVWFVTDANDVVRWYYDPQEIADQSRTQFGGLNESTFTEHENQLGHFVMWCKKKLNITKPLPRMVFQDEKEGPDQHRTGYYDDDTNTMWVYTGNRNLIDIMRTVCHELVHRKQHEHKKAKSGESYPFAPIEQEADAIAGGMIKLYVKEFPESIE